VTSLPTYIIRRTAMYTTLDEHAVRVMIRDRQLRAESVGRSDRTDARLVTVRRWQRIVYRTR
jgi:hypothetical protein